MKIKQIIFIIALAFFILSFGSANAVDSYKNKLFEYKLTSAKSYSHPTSDIDLFCEFTSPTGRIIKIRGFWNGAFEFRIRIAPDELGLWTAKTNCSDTNNTGLHGKQFSFNCIPNNDTNKLYKKGKLKVSADKRYLTYGDGDPFFYLGDTGWEMTWRSKLDEVKRYIADRKKKGFTAVQFIPMSCMTFFWDYGVINQNKDSFFLNKDRMMLNPRYFDYLDTLVQYMNDNEVVAVLVPLWAGFCVLHPTPWACEKFSVAESINLAKYIGSRYSGYQVLWIITGDGDYNKPEQISFWNDFANNLRNSDGWQNLATLHSMGSTGTWNYFKNDTKWLDFNMFQSSHTFDAQYAWILGLEGWNQKPDKPTIDGEASYEEIPADFWVNDTSKVIKRITTPYIRKARYTSILSGSLVGITYGANGIFQWSTERNLGEFESRYPVDSAMKFAGSGHMAVIRNIMERYHWYTFKPAQDLLIGTDTKYHVAVSTNDSLIIAYLPMFTKYATIRLNPLFNTYNAYLLNPVSGQKTPGNLTINKDTLTCFPTDSNDVLVVVELKDPSKVISDDMKGIIGLKVFPNPSTGSFSFYWYSDTTNRIELQISDVCGRVIKSAVFYSDQGRNQKEWTLDQPGVYYYKITESNSSSSNTANGMIQITR